MENNDGRAICPNAYSNEKGLYMILETVNADMPERAPLHLIARMDERYPKLRKLEDGRTTDYHGHTLNYKDERETVLYAVQSDTHRKHYFVKASPKIIKELQLCQK